MATKTWSLQRRNVESHMKQHIGWKSKLILETGDLHKQENIVTEKLFPWKFPRFARISKICSGSDCRFRETKLFLNFSEILAFACFVSLCAKETIFLQKCFLVCRGLRSTWFVLVAMVYVREVGFYVLICEPRKRFCCVGTWFTSQTVHQAIQFDKVLLVQIRVIGLISSCCKYFYACLHTHLFKPDTCDDDLFLDVLN